MAQLSEAARRQVWRGLMRWWSSLREPLGAVSKDDLLAAVNATDTWIDNNEANYNAALPNPAKQQLTTGQKTLLFCAVALARVSVGTLRRLFGEVD